MQNKLQLVEQPSEPEPVAAEELTPGQFLAAGELTTGRPTEVLFVDTYPSDAARETLIVHRPIGVGYPFSSTVPGNRWFDLATELELAEFRASAERVNRIADIRRLATWLEDNPWAPMPSSFDASVHLDERHLGGPSEAESYAKVCEISERLGIEPEERLADRTVLRVPFGRVEYSVIAWHPDGRPGDPKPTPLTPTPITEHYQVRAWKGEGPGTCGIECACGVTYDGFDSLAEATQQLGWHIADPSGQDFGRADSAKQDDPTPIGRRVPPHTGGLTEAGWVDETPGES